MDKLLRIAILTIIVFFLYMVFTACHILKYVFVGERYVVRVLFGISYVIFFISFWLCRGLFLIMLGVYITLVLYWSIREAVTM